MKLLKLWEQAWPEALEVWSPYTRLSDPNWYFTTREEKAGGLEGSFAAIRLNDHRVMISLRQVAESGLDDYALEILAHEIGHHVFCPANLLESGKALALAIKALPTFEHQAPMIVNMWEDLLINDRLVRVHKQRHAEIYELLNTEASQSKLWMLYMRAYEILWGLRPGRLVKGKLKTEEEGDAHLVARMVRVYGQDWLAGVGGFACLCLTYLHQDKEAWDKAFTLHFDTKGLGEGCEAPLGVLELDGYDIVHPSMDPNIVGGGGQEEPSDGESEGRTNTNPNSKGGPGQSREPFLFGQVMEALGLELNKHDAAVRFYREKALPHLIPFPTREAEESTEPLMEGLEPWDVGHPMDEIDWMQSVMVSPSPIPGFTTVRRSWGIMGGTERDREPLDLDLYVDCSGSIPNPQQNFSYLALAGAIVVLSALRTGARVQATLWSGSRQFDTTNGFITDEMKLLRVLTGYLGGGTAFPNHMLVDTYSRRKDTDRPVHILVLSDEGIDAMARPDNRGTDGMAISQMALDKARGGGTMVLNLYRKEFLQNKFSQRCRQLGWEMFMVKDWSGLLEFARQFSRMKYGQLRK